MDALVVKNEIGNIVTCLGGKDADARPCKHIAQPMLVVGHAHKPCGSGNGIGPDAYPGANVPIFFGKHGGRHESSGSVSRRERVVV